MARFAVLLSSFSSSAATCLVLVSIALGQVPDPTLASMAHMPGSAHEYIGTGQETVNPADGSLEFNLPIQPPAGRQLSIPFAIHYRASMYYFLSSVNVGGVDTYPALTWLPIPGGGSWDYSVPSLAFQADIARAWYSATGQGQTFQYHQCDETSNFVFRGLDGLQYPIAGTTSWSDPNLPPDPNNCPYVPDVAFSIHGNLETPAQPPYSLYPGQPAMTVTDHSGTTYQFPAVYVGSLTGYTPPAFGWNTRQYAQTITDRNGNQLNLGATFQNQQTTYFYTDTLGRQAVSWNGGLVTIAGLGGNIAVKEGTNNQKTTFPEVLHPGSGDDTCSVNNVEPYEKTGSTISEIDLPNGQTYSFGYDNTFGLVNKITFPGGGYVRYNWNLNQSSDDGRAQHSFAVNNAVYLRTCTFTLDTPAVVDRYVSYDGQTEVLHQHFAYSTNYSPVPPFLGEPWVKRTTVTTTDSVTGHSFITEYNYGPMKADTGSFWRNNIVPVERSVVYKDGSGNILRTENKTWGNIFEPIGDQIILENGQGSAIQRCYDSNEQLTNLYEYGFQSEGSKPTDPACYTTELQLGSGGSGDPGLVASMIGPLTRQTAIVYHNFTGASPSTHIVNKPDSVIVSNGSGSAVKQSTYAYDASSVQLSHATTGLVSPPARRGNVTSASRWLNTNNSWLKTTYTYLDTGQLASMTDPCGNATCSDMTGSNHTTTYSYTDNYASGTGTPPGQTNAYLTLVTHPNTGVAHTESFSWGYSDGLLRSSTDQNNQPTSYQYNDPLNRLTETDFPDGGKTTIAYNDAIGSPSVTTTTLMTPSQNYQTETIFDGMGHPRKTDLLSDPGGITYSRTSYDGLGRPYQEWNPTRCDPDVYSTSCSGETTFGITTHTYDALGRPSLVTEQDGSKVTTSYSGSCTTATDEASRARESCSDGLGRMTGVWEDPGSSPHLNYYTAYSYDALSNLTGVIQNGSNSANARKRSFTYDSLSRLLCVANPEVQSVTCPASAPFPTGAITYSYDADSNVITKRAPSPNQPSTGNATVTTTYAYDNLSRLIGKSYTDTYASNPATPSVSYAYDSGSLSNCPTYVGFAGGGTSGNGVGRRTAMCFAGGSKSWIYDQMGRVHAENDDFIWVVPPYSAQVATLNGIPTLGRNTTYAYYLNGDLSDYFYPGPYAPQNYQFYTGENAAGQVNTAGDDLNKVLTNATYTPTGQLATGLIGAGSFGTKGSAISNTYNNRLQPVLLSASTAGGTPIINLTYNFNLGNGTTGSDNGNVIQIVNGKDNNRSQNFLYDSLNRIQQAYTSGPNWGETYSPNVTAPGVAPSVPGIDAWGNLTNRSGVTGKTNSESSLNCAGGNGRNQLNTCFTYDAAGNVITNGSVNYVYDAENRLIATAGRSYVYDGDGQRVEKCTQGATPGTCASNATGTFYWLLTDGGTIGESDLGGNWTALYGLIRGEIASRVDLPANVIRYYFHDHLKTTNVVTDTLGNVVEESDFYPYGGEIPITGSDPNRYKFTGKERDSESGLDNFGFRYYSSSMGRFMKPDDSLVYWDRSDPQSLNLYSYAENNPVSNTDDDGHDCVYLNNAGNGVESVDQSSSSGECGGSGGYWVQGAVTNAQISGDSLSLTGTTNGVDNNTSASHFSVQHRPMYR